MDVDKKTWKCLPCVYFSKKHTDRQMPVEHTWMPLRANHRFFSFFAYEMDVEWHAASECTVQHFITQTLDRREVEPIASSAAVRRIFYRVVSSQRLSDSADTFQRGVWNEDFLPEKKHGKITIHITLIVATNKKDLPLFRTLSVSVLGVFLSQFVRAVCKRFVAHFKYVYAQSFELVSMEWVVTRAYRTTKKPINGSATES